MVRISYQSRDTWACANSRHKCRMHSYESWNLISPRSPPCAITPRENFNKIGTIMSIVQWFDKICVSRPKMGYPPLAKIRTSKPQWPHPAWVGPEIVTLHDKLKALDCHPSKCYPRLPLLNTNDRTVTGVLNAIMSFEKFPYKFKTTPCWTLIIH